MVTGRNRLGSRFCQILELLHALGDVPQLVVNVALEVIRIDLVVNGLLDETRNAVIDGLGADEGGGFQEVQGLAHPLGHGAKARDRDDGEDAKADVQAGLDGVGGSALEDCSAVRRGSAKGMQDGHVGDLRAGVVLVAVLDRCRAAMCSSWDFLCCLYGQGPCMGGLQGS